MTYTTSVVQTRVAIRFFIYPMGRIRVCKIRFVRIEEIAENLVWYARKKQAGVRKHLSDSIYTRVKQTVKKQMRLFFEP